MRLLLVFLILFALYGCAPELGMNDAINVSMKYISTHGKFMSSSGEASDLKFALIDATETPDSWIVTYNVSDNASKSARFTVEVQKSNSRVTKVNGAKVQQDFIL